MTLNPAEVVDLVAHCGPGIRNVSTVVSNDVCCKTDRALYGRHIHVWYVYILYQCIVHFSDVKYFNAS